MFNTVLVLHFVGWIVLIAGFIGSFRSHHFSKALLPGALLSAITGVGLMFIPNADGIAAGFSAQVGVKIALTVIIAGLAAYALSLVSKKADDADSTVSAAAGTATNVLTASAPWLLWAIGGLTVITLAIAFLWR